MDYEERTWKHTDFQEIHFHRTLSPSVSPVTRAISFFIEPAQDIAFISLRVPSFRNANRQTATLCKQDGVRRWRQIKWKLTPSGPIRVMGALVSAGLGNKQNEHLGRRQTEIFYLSFFFFFNHLH